MDVPVSIQADAETVSLALFWDTRIYGTLKFFDFATFKTCKTLNLDNFVEVTINANTDIETLLSPANS